MVASATMKIVVPMLGALAGLGCHGSAPAVDAVVVERPEAPKGGVLKTMPGARASIACPDLKTPPADITTGENGLAHFYMERRWHRGCVLTIAKDGYESQRVTIGDACAKHEEEPNAEYCALWTVVVVELTPRAK